MKVQPIDSNTADEPKSRFEPVKPVGKSRLKRLFERQFLKSSVAEKAVVVEESHFNGGSADFEPSSVCLANMVQSFIEESNEKQPSAAVRCGNCFNGNFNDSSDDEWESFGGSSGDSILPSFSEACEFLKNLVPCVSLWERNILADTARIVDKNKICRRKDDLGRKIVTDGLLALGYDASVCKSRWERTPSYPAGEYEYIDVVINGERLLIDVDFRSEFEIARSTKAYKSLLQILPYIFVGNADRLQKIIAIVSEAAKQSLKKKDMHIPPWRKADYVKAKWLSPYTRITPAPILTPTETNDPKPVNGQSLIPKPIYQIGLRSTDKKIPMEDGELCETVFEMSSESSVEEEKTTALHMWEPPPVAEVKPKSIQSGIKIVTGLASVIEDEP